MRREMFSGGAATGLHSHRGFISAAASSVGLEGQTPAHPTTPRSTEDHAMNLKKTILASALLAATSVAFAKEGNKPDSPPAGGNAPTEQRNDFGQDTAERAQTVGTDADARATMGEDTSAAAQARNDDVETPDDPEIGRASCRERADDQ